MNKYIDREYIIRAHQTSLGTSYRGETLGTLGFKTEWFDTVLEAKNSIEKLIELDVERIRQI